MCGKVTLNGTSGIQGASMPNFVVTFSNAGYASPGQDLEAHITVPVDFGFEVTRENLDVQVELLCALAVDLWDEDDTDWDGDEPGWEVVSVTLPSGEVVDL